MHTILVQAGDTFTRKQGWAFAKRKGAFNPFRNLLCTSTAYRCVEFGLHTGAVAGAGASASLVFGLGGVCCPLTWFSLPLLLQALQRAIFPHAFH